MARKGSHKVRTGCFTCKKRKVKCDEAKPSCDRCVNTGRTCDGYTPPPPGHYSWAELLGKRAIVPAITPRRNTQDGRAFDFYHHVVAPALSRFPGDEFWTRMVSQASMQEPAVRHAVLSISSIYELVDDIPSDQMLLDPKGRYAMVQYNQALHHLSQSQDESVVLFSCVLFICLEILRDNKMGALTHVAHGVRVFNNCRNRRSSWAADYLRPIFTRLTSCPFFFGATEKALPILSGVGEGQHISGHQESYEIARYRLDLLTARSIRFVRQYEAVASDRPKDTPDYTGFEEEQVAIVSGLDDWAANYDILEATTPPPSKNTTPLLLMRMIYIVLKIWVLVCRETDEMAYDSHMDSFAKIVDLARQAAETESEKRKLTSDPAPKSKFVLEMGFIPVLYFVVTKCRNLSLRLAALKYLPLLAPERENLWNATTMYAVAKKIVEMEHGPLDANGQVVHIPKGWHPDLDLEEPRGTDAAPGGATLSPGNPEGNSLGRAPSPPRLSPEPPSGLRIKDVLVLSERDLGDGAGPVPAYPHKPGATVAFIVGPDENLKRVDACLEDEDCGKDEDRSVKLQRVRVISDFKPV
ncbi:hypothetical protein QBC39DRAFT_88934 [Podospora conica]|nr:hypothetical protein QBC39DRAFT_88934 [Schizothecium conicum]